MYKVTINGPDIKDPNYNKKRGMGFAYNSTEMYRFSLDINSIENMINWLFEYTTGRFHILGTNIVYFELEEDAMAFKLGWI